MNRSHPHFAVTRDRAAKRETTLKNTLPRNIASHIGVARSGGIFYRGVLVAEFLSGGTMIATRDRRVIPVSDVNALTRLIRGVFFPGDYTDARKAVDAHEDRRQAWEAGDDAAAARAERTLRRLRKPGVAA